MQTNQTRLGVILLALLLVACASNGNSGATGSGAEPQGTAPESAVLSLPQAEPVVAADEALQAVATTSIVGDVVTNVGGEALDLTVLMDPGQDPHSYDPTAEDLTAAARADVIFVHGWDLEEGLGDDLSRAGEEALIVPVAANIDPLLTGDNGRVDPHTWLDPHLVLQWVDNVEAILSGLDPARSEAYAGNAEAYRQELAELIAYYDEQVARIPPERRQLVTNHDALAYFAAAYDFQIVGTVIPGSSTMAEPSASGLATLVQDMQEAGVCTIFAETTVSTELAQTAAAELSACDEVQVVQLYTGATGPAGSGASSYIEMMRANIDAIVAGLGAP